MKVKIDALRLYALGIGFRAIGKSLGFSNVAVLKRIKGF
jgi:transposase-like protein